MEKKSDSSSRQRKGKKSPKGKEHKDGCYCHKCMMKKVSTLEETVTRLTFASEQMFNIVIAAFNSPAHAYEALRILGEQYEFEVPTGDTERQAQIED